MEHEEDPTGADLGEEQMPPDDELDLDDLEGLEDDDGYGDEDDDLG